MTHNSDGENYDNFNLIDSSLSLQLATMLPINHPLMDIDYLYYFSVIAD
ncbi:MAG: hypothetical protein QNJ08_18150 [Crocosphaera sp.]|nr:hypothetical protein [Crocosphaera sp.]